MDKHVDVIPLHFVAYNLLMCAFEGLITPLLKGNMELVLRNNIFDS